MAALDKAIETQEELDAIIQKRIKREQEKLEKEKKDALDEANRKAAELEKQIASFAEKAKETETKDAETAKTISELEGKVKSYEATALKTRIAHELAIPYELAARLTGEDEQAIRADAENLSKVLGTQKHKTAPSKSTETSADPTAAAYASILSDFKGE